MVMGKKKKKKVTKSQKKFQKQKKALQARREQTHSSIPAQRSHEIESTSHGASQSRWPDSYIFKDEDELHEYLTLFAGEVLDVLMVMDICDIVFDQFSLKQRTVRNISNFAVKYLNENASIYDVCGDADPFEWIYESLIKLAPDWVEKSHLFGIAEDLDNNVPDRMVTNSFMQEIINQYFNSNTKKDYLAEQATLSSLSSSSKRSEKRSKAKPVSKKVKKKNEALVNRNFTPALPAEKRIEFFGKNHALLADANDPDPGLAMKLRLEKRMLLQCSCKEMKATGRQCRHLSELMNILRAEGKGGAFSLETFEASLYEKTFKPLVTDSKSQLDNIQITYTAPFDNEIKIHDLNEVHLFTYHGMSNDDRVRFVDRIKMDLEAEGAADRASILRDLYHEQLTDQEVQMIESGYRTPRILYQNSIWQRIAYHLFMEFGDSLAFAQLSGPDGTGITAFFGKNKVFTTMLPENKVNGALKVIEKRLLEFDPVDMVIPTARASFTVRETDVSTFEVEPVVTFEHQGEKHTIKQANLRGLNFGGTSYLEEFGFVDVALVPEEHELNAINKQVLSGDEIPAFAIRFAKAIKSGDYSIPDNLKTLKVLRQPERLTVETSALDRDWCYLSFHYQSGETDISLTDIVNERERSRSRYIQHQSVWIDTEDEQLAAILDGYDDVCREFIVDGKLRLCRMGLLKYAALLPVDLVAASGTYNSEMNSLLTMTPPLIPSISSMNCELRHYQQNGLGWLYFLTVNRLGGLLCDDMGLGKTHQTMALMTALVEEKNETRPFLVVCPTTVISHWEDKIKRFAPALTPIIYHGIERELEEHHGKGDVILTSYGIMLRDADKLNEYEFAVIAYDEVHYLKNNRTKSYRAARSLNAEVSIGLTGTPIENSLVELKSLFDLVLPGYLGRDKEFKEEYINPIEDNGDSRRRELLRRLITPFTLRRLKEAVLEELPPKIEDIRICELSPEQTALYKDAIASQASSLKATLQNSKEKVPYIHIFALLDMLKQICNHPALVEKKPQNYNKKESGKWELFKEILHEVLESGHKVVIFSQYLGMIDMMERHLKKEKVGHVSLTGSTTKRGEVIRRFNEDEDCRVFIGSLMASGTGIDLVSASIVIHYDRWWNAAKEDQATDRVHRIGQKRGVQVFKFVTEGTLEEKISAIIDRKRSLMNDVVQEDDADMLKSFDRSDLLELLGDIGQ